MAKIYIDNAKYMEFIDDIATQMTEIAYKGKATLKVTDFIVGDTCNSDSYEGLFIFTEEAQDYYNERYDEVETMLNKTLNIHSNEHTDRDN
jgi:hypothetical protein